MIQFFSADGRAGSGSVLKNLPGKNRSALEEVAMAVTGLQETVLEVPGLEELAKEAPSLEELAPRLALDGFV